MKKFHHFQFLTATKYLELSASITIVLVRYTGTNYVYDT